MKPQAISPKDSLARRILRTAAMCGIGAVTICGPTELSYNRPYFFFTTQSKIVEKLIVNRDDTYYTVACKSQEQGVNDLRKLVQQERHEDSWVYLPGGYWIERGINSRTWGSVKASVEDNKALLEEIIEDYQNIALYHIHPIKPEEVQDSREIKITWIHDQQQDWMQLSIPSDRDILYFLSIAAEFYRIHPEGNITSNICAHYGITTLSIAEESRNPRKIAGLLTKLSEQMEEDSKPNSLLKKTAWTYYPPENKRKNGTEENDQEQSIQKELRRIPSEGILETSFRSYKKE